MWQNKYIGIPYKDYGRDSSGIDCWGLACLVYREEFNINLPSFSEPDTYNADDRTNIAEIIAQNTEGWLEVDVPEAGNLVLFRIMGQPSHIGVAVSATHFIHAMEGHSCTIEAFESINWKHRRVGFYKYTPQIAANNLVAVPHPLRSQKVVMNVAYGSTIQQVYDTVNQQHNISDRLKKHITILKNSRVVPHSEWGTTVVQHGDTLEYRAVPGKDVGRLVLTLIVVYIAVQTGMYFGGTEATIFGTGVGTATAGQAAMITQGVMMAGTMLVNAIMPIRPPAAQEDTGLAKAQLMFTGGPNRSNPYGAIPFVLGKMRVTPPLGAQNYIRFGELTSGIIESADASYLDMLLVWGYGPLQIDDATMRIGEISTYDYSTTPPTPNFEKLRYITLDRKSTESALEQTEFDAIYGKDVEQINKGIELTCEGLPPIVEGSLTNSLPWTPSTTPGPWLEAGFQSPCDKISVALHFPQGLRRIKAQGSGAGSSNAAPVSVTLEFRTASNTAWQPWTTQTIGGTLSSLGEQTYVPDSYNNSGGENTEFVPGYYQTLTANTITGGAPKKDAFTWTITKDRVTNSIEAWSAGEALQVRVRRNTGDNTEPNDNYRYSHTVVFQNATTISNNKPAVDPKYSKIAKTALSIQATDQLNSQMDGVNAIVQTWCLDWNGTVWAEAATSNPASLFRYVLQSPANPQRVLDADVASKIDLVQLQYWHTFCNQTRTDPTTGETYKFEFNDIIASQRSVLDILRDICAAGKASPALIDGRWTVVIDEPRTQVIQHFSPHNSWGFESTKMLPKFPDALKVQFYDQDKDYEQRELIIPFAGKTVASSELFETIQLPGVTKAALARDHARWHMAQTKLRPEVYTLNSDIEYLVCNRGDLVKVTHDVPMWGLGSGRIKNRISSTEFELDEELPFNAGVTYTLRIRSKTGTSTTRNIVAKTVDGYYSNISVTASTSSDEVDIGDLVLFGELNQEAQDLIVLNIEPGNNKTAKLTLVDYGVTDSYNIFTDYLTYSSSDIFESQVTIPTKLLLNSFGEKKPTITRMVSDETVMEVVSPGVFAYKLQVSFTNDIDLPTTTSHVQGQIDYENATDSIGIRTISTEFNKGSLLFSDVDELAEYRVRLRYIGSDGRLGKWTDWTTHTIVGKTNPPSTPTGLTITADSSSGQLLLNWNANLEPDISEYEIRTENANWGTENPARVFLGKTLSVRTKPSVNTDESVFYIKAIDSSGNYSVTSAFASFTVTAPSAPQNFSYNYFSNSATSTTATLKWSAPASSTFAVTNYEIQLQKITGTTIITANTTEVSINVDWTGSFNVNIIAIDINGNRSAALSGILLKDPPEAPGAITYTVVDNTIVAEWVSAVTTSLPIAGYEIRNNPTGWGDNAYVAKIPSNTATISKFITGSNTWYIRAYDTAGEYSTTSSSEQFTVSIPNAPTAVTIQYSDTNISGAQANISWTASSISTFRVSKYQIEITKYPGPTISIITSDTTSISVGVDWRTEADITVRAIDITNRVSNKSSNLNSEKIAPSVPLNVIVTPSNVGGVTISWDSATKGTLPLAGYELRTESANPGVPGFVYQGSAASVVIPNITTGLNTWYLWSYDTDGQYSQTNTQISFTTAAPNPVTNISLAYNNTSNTTSTALFTWTEPLPSMFKVDAYEVSFAYTSPTNTTITNIIYSTSWEIPANWVGDGILSITVRDVQGAASNTVTYTAVKSLPNTPPVISSIPKGTDLELDWEDNIVTSLPVTQYELRDTNSNWGSPGFTWKGSSSNTRVGPLVGTGLRSWYLKAIDSDGKYSQTARQVDFTIENPTNPVVYPAEFSSTSLTNASVILTWDPVSPEFGLKGYEVTYGSVTELVNTTLITLPADWIGDRVYIIKTVDLLNNKSSGVSITATKLPPNPVLDFRAQIIDNNVLLYWNLPARTTLPVSHVMIRKGDTFANSIDIGEKDGTFTSFSELSGGTFTYWISTVDTDNRESAPTQIGATVSQPPDFVFNAEYLSDFSGIKVNASIEGPDANNLILPINTSESFEAHFTSRGWDQPSDQIAAGYPIYAQPGASSGYYEEVFDYGTVLGSSQITTSISATNLIGNPTVVYITSTSLDGVTYVDYSGTSSIFALNFRYIKVRITVNQTQPGDLFKISTLSVRLDAKQRSDSGNVNALSTDTFGTIVNFAKEFIDVTSITLTAKGTTPLTAVYDYRDSVLSGTYSVTNNVITVTATNHGFIVGQKLNLFFTTGSAISAIYTIASVPNQNTFTINTNTVNTSGTVSIYANSMLVYLFNSTGTRASGSVSWTARGY